MRTKLFFSFIVIILLALLSNIVFEHLIMKDFQEYVQSTNEDHIYWLLAAVEGAYRGREGRNEWDRELLSEALHWGMMLGFESYVTDAEGRMILSSGSVYASLSETMLKRMNSMFVLPHGEGEFQWYPLFVAGQEVGGLYIRPLKRLGNVPLKELIFRKRGRTFLLISFLIAGGGALCLAVIFTVFLSNPLRRLTAAAERVGKGDFSLKVIPQHRFSRLYQRLRCTDEIDRLTESFNYMVEALRKEDTLRRHLTSNIAHELRTPLTILRGNLEAIEDGVIERPEDVLKSMKDEVMRLINLVEGIEDITRAEASFFKMGEKETVDLKEFITSLAEAFRGLCTDRGLYLRLKGPSLIVKTYPDKLHIILKNLLTNGIRFTERGGIEIRWGKLKTGGFFISVSDTGPGIPEEQQQKVFERFYKGERSQGRGLGLSIVKELIETMGGRIILRSRPGEGSEFTVELPNPL